LKPPFVEAVKNFRDELYQRLIASFKKRVESDYFEERENLYLIFGEGDYLPGLFVQKLGNIYLIQFYARYWTQIEDVFLRIFNKVMSDFDFKGQVLLQERYPNAKSKTRRIDKKTQVNSLQINENGIIMEIHPGRAHDPGIYTDAASIRDRMTKYLERAKSVLNLYCYTGAFSLQAMKKGAHKVVSVDLSGKYLQQLEKNIALNKDLNPEIHQSIESDVNKEIAKMGKAKESFDLVICDPPSASSDGKKMSSAVKNYEKLLPKLYKITNSKGYLAIFLNTHNVTRNSFKNKIQDVIKKEKLKLDIVREWSLTADCPVSRGFPEGDYLKVLILEKK
jgi:23S rRNA (cytosine1962-C5)-methyltransferase